MTQSSSIGQVQVWLRGFVDSMNFTWSGNDQSLGRDVAWKVVEQIEDRAQREKRGIGEEWEANALDYAAWKEKRYGIVDLPNTRIGHMLSHQKLFGRTRVEAEQVTMIYGMNEPPTRTKTVLAAAQSNDQGRQSAGCVRPAAECRCEHAGHSEEERGHGHERGVNDGLYVFTTPLKLLAPSSRTESTNSTSITRSINANGFHSPGMPAVNQW
jgi:hypothetical protein